MDQLGRFIDHDHQVDVRRGRGEENVDEAPARLPIYPLHPMGGEVVPLKIGLRHRGRIGAKRYRAQILGFHQGHGDTHGRLKLGFGQGCHFERMLPDFCSAAGAAGMRLPPSRRGFTINNWVSSLAGHPLGAPSTLPVANLVKARGQQLARYSRGVVRRQG